MTRPDAHMAAFRTRHQQIVGHHRVLLHRMTAERETSEQAARERWPILWEEFA